MSTALSTAVFADEDNSDAGLDSSFSDLNTDNGGDGISQDEWGSGFDRNGAFNSWDSNSDGQLSPEEHRNGYFTCFDSDKNGRMLVIAACSADEKNFVSNPNAGVFGRVFRLRARLDKWIMSYPNAMLWSSQVAVREVPIRRVS